jgi:hypothetical protein
MTLWFALALAAGLQTGNASRYGYAGDTLDQVGSFACQRRLEARFGGRGFRALRDRGVAHRTLPCGTPLAICLPRTGRCTSAYVVDRGPWGALNRRGEWHQRTDRLRPGEHYRGELDLLPNVFNALGLLGIENVLFWPQPVEPAASKPQS